MPWELELGLADKGPPRNLLPKLSWLYSLGSILCTVLAPPQSTAQTNKPIRASWQKLSKRLVVVVGNGRERLLLRRLLPNNFPLRGGGMVASLNCQGQTVQSLNQVVQICRPLTHSQWAGSPTTSSESDQRKWSQDQEQLGQTRKERQGMMKSKSKGRWQKAARREIQGRKKQQGKANCYPRSMMDSPIPRSWLEQPPWRQNLPEQELKPNSSALSRGSSCDQITANASIQSKFI